MKSLTATELARNLSRVLDNLEYGREEIVITRNKRSVARLVPGAPSMTAHEAMNDLYGLLLDEEGAAWLRDARGREAVLSEELRDPWE